MPVNVSGLQFIEKAKNRVPLCKNFTWYWLSEVVIAKNRVPLCKSFTWYWLWEVVILGLRKGFRKNISIEFPFRPSKDKDYSCLMAKRSIQCLLGGNSFQAKILIGMWSFRCNLMSSNLRCSLVIVSCFSYTHYCNCSCSISNINRV